MAIQKISNNVVDGETKIGKATFQPYADRINALIDAVANLSPSSTAKVLIAGEADNAEHGRVSIHGLTKTDVNCPAYYAEVGEYVVLHAIDGTDYTFSKWVDSEGTTISTLRDMTILVDSSMSSGKTYKAVFVGSTVNITTSVNDATMGSVSGAGTKTKGNEVTLTATAKQYYEFVKWQVKNGSLYEDIPNATDSEYTFTATEDAEYRAMFIASEIGVIYVQADKTDNSLKITSINAVNATSYKLIINEVEEEFDGDAGKEISATSTIVVKAVNDSTNKSKTCAIVTAKYDADTDTCTATSTAIMHYTTDGTSPTESSTSVAVGSELVIEDDVTYNVLSGGNTFSFVVKTANS